MAKYCVYLQKIEQAVAEQGQVRPKHVRTNASSLSSVPITPITSLFGFDPVQAEPVFQVSVFLMKYHVSQVLASSHQNV